MYLEGLLLSAIVGLLVSQILLSTRVRRLEELADAQLPLMHTILSKLLKLPSADEENAGVSHHHETESQ